MKLDKNKIKDAVKFSIIGLAVAVGLGIVFWAVLTLFTEDSFIMAFILAIFIYGIFCGWTLVNLILTMFCSDKYNAKYSVIGIYYGGAGLACAANTLLPNMSVWLHLLIGFGIAFAANFIIIDTTTSRKEKERREYEAECQAFLKGKESGFKEGYKAGYKNAYNEQESIVDSNVEKENNESIIDEEILETENDNDPQATTWTQRAEKEFIKLGYKKGNKTGTSVIVTNARPKGYSAIMNELLSKTRPDGIYIDPETKEEFNMNDPYDREEAVMAEIFRQEIEQQKNP